MITPAERTLIEHNLMGAGMYEGMDAGLKQFPEQFAAANREDFPYIALGDVLGTCGPCRPEIFLRHLQGCRARRRRARLLAGSYGGVATYVEFMRRLSDMGLPMTENKALCNSCLGAAVYLRRRRHAEHRRRRRRDPARTGAGFGVPTDADYQWAEQLHPDPLLKQMPPLVADAHKMSVATPEKRREAMRSAYAAGRHNLDALWPNLFVAEIKGLAMLRNLRRPSRSTRSR